MPLFLAAIDFILPDVNSFILYQTAAISEKLNNIYIMQILSFQTFSHVKGLSYQCASKHLKFQISLHYAKI